MARLNHGILTRLLAIAIGLLWLLSLPCLAAEAEKPFVVLPHWKKGEKRNYEMFKSRERFKEGKAVLKAAGRMDVTVEVLGADKNGYVIGWTYNILSDDPRLGDNPVVESMLALLKGYRVILNVDSQGEITGVQNWRQIQETVKSLSEVVIRQKAKDAALVEAEKEKMGKVLAALMGTEEQVTLLCTREVQVFLFVLGQELALPKGLEYENQLPNPFGGDPFTARGSLTLKTKDQKTGSATFVLSQKLDPDTTARALEKIMREMIERTGRPLPEGQMMCPLAVFRGH